MTRYDQINGKSGGKFLFYWKRFKLIYIRNRNFETALKIFNKKRNMQKCGGKQKMHTENDESSKIRNQEKSIAQNKGIRMTERVLVIHEVWKK